MHRKWISLVLIMSSIMPYSGVSLAGQDADPRFYRHEEDQIPKTPSAPPLLLQKNPSNLFHCERYFLFDGKKQECDSNLGHDARNLRPLLQDLPAAIAELDAYQKEQSHLKTAARLSTLGLLIAVVGIIISHPPLDANGRLRPGGYLMVGGLGITLGSVGYGLTSIRFSERHIGNAVQIYNDAHPERPIELQFSTGFHF